MTHLARPAFALATVFLLGAARGQATTTWLGATSTNWFAAANWSNGVPDATKVARIAAGTFGCSPAGSDTLPPEPTCGGLVVLPGSTLTLNGGTIAVRGDIQADASVLGSGTIRALPTSTPGLRQIDSAAGVTLPGLAIDRESTTSTWRIGTVSLRGSFSSFADVTLATRLEVQGGASFGRSGFSSLTFQGLSGSTLIVNGPATLLSGGLSGDQLALDITCNTTSVLSATAGTIRVVPNKSLVIRAAHDSTLGTVSVPPTSSLTHLPSNFASPSSARITQLNCDGSSLIMNPLVDAIAGSGTVTLTSTGGQVFPATLRAINGPTTVVWDYVGTPALTLVPAAGAFVVPAGARLESRGLVEVASSSLRLDGELEVRPGGRVQRSFGDLAIDVGSTGALRLNGSQTGSAVIDCVPSSSGYDVTLTVAGILSGSRGFLPSLNSITFSGAGTVAASPDDLSNSYLNKSAGTPAPYLLEFGSSAPIRFGSASLNGPGGALVRATTPAAVNLAATTSSSFGLEDDALGVISWNTGVDFHGIVAPGCRGLIKCEANSTARLGSTSFAVFTENADPQLGAVLFLGLGGLAAPVLIGPLESWIDLGQTTFINTYPSNPSGRVTAPQTVPSAPAFAGLSVFAQFLTIEQPWCAPLGVSVSTAMHFVLLP